jgi:hypothetical protein
MIFRRRGLFTFEGSFPSVQSMRPSKPFTPGIIRGPGIDSMEGGSTWMPSASALKRARFRAGTFTQSPSTSIDSLGREGAGGHNVVFAKLLTY